MGFIESIFSQMDAFLTSVGESQFASVAGAFANTGSLLATVAVLVILVNMGTQTVPVDKGEALGLIVRIALVGLFMQSWAQFNAVMSAFQNLFAGMEAAMLQAAFPRSGGSVTSFATALDSLGNRMAEFANQTSGGLNIMGAVINGIMMLFIAIFGAICALAMVAVRLGLAVLIAIAPLAIMATLLRQSSEYFAKWVSAVITMLLAPVVLAGVFASVVAMGEATIGGLNPDSTTTLGQVIPVLGVIIMGIIMVMGTPFLLGLITGNVQLGSMARAVQGAAFGMAGTAAARGLGMAGRGVQSAVGGAQAVSTNAAAQTAARAAVTQRQGARFQAARPPAGRR